MQHNPPSGGLCSFSILTYNSSRRDFCILLEYGGKDFARVPGTDVFPSGRPRPLCHVYDTLSSPCF